MILFHRQAKITPCLCFDKADEAVNLYISIFKNAKILSIAYWVELSILSRLPLGYLTVVCREHKNGNISAIRTRIHGSKWCISLQIQ